MKRIALTVLVVLATGVVPAYAESGPSCSTRDKTVISNAQVRVFSIGRDAEKDYFGCLRGGDRIRRLSDSGIDYGPAGFVLAGTIVGYVEVLCSRYDDSPCAQRMFDVDLRDGTKRLQGPFYDLRGARIEVTSRRDTAIVAELDGNQGHVIIYKRDREGFGRLGGTDIDPDSVRVTEKTVAWRDSSGLHTYIFAPSAANIDFRRRPVVTYTRTSGETCCFHVILTTLRALPVDQTGRTDAGAKLDDIYVASLSRIGPRRRNCYTGSAPVDGSKSRVINNPRRGDSVTLRVIAAGTTIATRRVGIAPGGETSDAQTRRTLRDLGCL